VLAIFPSPSVGMVKNFPSSTDWININGKRGGDILQILELGVGLIPWPIHMGRTRNFLKSLS